LSNHKAVARSFKILLFRVHNSPFLNTFLFKIYKTSKHF